MVQWDIDETVSFPKSLANYNFLTIAIVCRMSYFNCWFHFALTEQNKQNINLDVNYTTFYIS